jgi:hypothetical protein
MSEKPVTEVSPILFGGFPESEPCANVGAMQLDRAALPVIYVFCGVGPYSAAIVVYDQDTRWLTDTHCLSPQTAPAAPWTDRLNHAEAA